LDSQTIQPRAALVAALVSVAAAREVVWVSLAATEQAVIHSFLEQVAVVVPEQPPGFLLLV
jgi:hypothetical protein